jgi:Na+/H+-dicarboxylate symporter
LNQLRFIAPRSFKHLTVQIEALVRGRLWAKVLAGLVLGLVLGILIGPSVGWVTPQISQLLSRWFALPGELFLAVIQMVVIPLVVSSIIRGLASTEDVDQLRRLGPRIAVYFLVTTTVAITIGLLVTRAIEPGRFVDRVQAVALARDVAEPPAEPAVLPDLDELPGELVEILPENPLGSMVEAQMLQVVVFSVFIGLALLAMPARQSRPLLELMGSLQGVCMTVIRWAMSFAPYAVFGLMVSLASTLGFDVLLGMGVYVVTVLVGLGLLLVVYLLIISVVGCGPMSFLRAVRQVQLLAFSTSSSAAVMPLSIRTAEDELGVRPSISGLLVPLGATVNMDGTALYQGVATLFLAQVFGIDLSLATLVLVVTTAVTASIGAPAAPGVGIVILASILEGAGIPSTGIAMILGVDRILDMSRTAVNVTGDLAACIVMDRWVGSHRTADEERAAETKREERRAVSGEDVIDDSSRG